MATMNRNVNLEEINSDAFLGIPFLNYQSPFQKLIFWGSVILGVLWNILATFVFHINSNIVVIVTIFPLMLGVLFGCNFNQDLTLFQYIILILFKPSKVYVNKPSEDLKQIKATKERMKKEEELRMREELKASPEEQKRLLIKLALGVAIAVVLFIILLIVIASTRTDVIHHIITE